MNTWHICRTCYVCLSTENRCCLKPAINNKNHVTDWLLNLQRNLKYYYLLLEKCEWKSLKTTGHISDTDFFKILQWISYGEDCTSWTGALMRIRCERHHSHHVRSISRSVASLKALVQDVIDFLFYNTNN